MCSHELPKHFECNCEDISDTSIIANKCNIYIFLRLSEHIALPAVEGAYFGDYMGEHNITQYNTIQYDTMRCDAMRCDATRRDATRRDATRRDATQRNATQRNATQHNTTQYNTIQYNTIALYCPVNGKLVYSVP